MKQFEIVKLAKKIRFISYYDYEETLNSEDLTLLTAGDYDGQAHSFMSS